MFQEPIIVIDGSLNRSREHIFMKEICWPSSNRRAKNYFKFIYKTRKNLPVAVTPSNNSANLQLIFQVAAFCHSANNTVVARFGGLLKMRIPHGWPYPERARWWLLGLQIFRRSWASSVRGSRLGSRSHCDRVDRCVGTR